jgi:hypothetical protein
MGTELDIAYGYKTRPSSLLSSIFMSTVNAAAKTLVSVAKTEQAKWKASDHLRFVVMLMTWVAVWVLRVLMDYFPCSVGFSPQYLLSGFSSVGSLDLSSSSSLMPSFPSLDLIVHEELDGPSVQALKQVSQPTWKLIYFSLPTQFRQVILVRKLRKKICTLT